MERDFSAQAFASLSAVIDQLEAEQICGLTDWIGDAWISVKHFFSKLGLYDCTADLEQYHRDMLDLEDTTKGKLQEIFEKVSSVDSSCGEAVDDLADALKSFEERLQALSSVSSNAARVVSGGGSLRNCLNADAINLARVMSVESKTLTKVNFTSDTFAMISEQYKQRYVAEFESNDKNRTVVALLAQVLSDPDLTAQERLDIKFLIYNAPEPYRSIYIQHLRQYVVNVTPGQDGSWYHSGLRQIFLRDDDGTFRLNPRGPYNTFFHESGHAIDDFEYDSGSLTRYYTWNGRTLHSYIVSDVRSHVESVIDSDPTLRYLTPAQRQEILRSLNLTDDASFAYEGTALTDPTLSSARSRLVSLMHNSPDELYGEVNEAASDVYGGVTNNALVGSWGHRRDKPGVSYNYWYYDDGTATHMQESELWAEFYAAQMTHDTAALDSIRRHFPKAYEAMEEMARQMAKS